MCYTWSDWTCSPHKMPIEWLIVLKMEASSHLLHWHHVYEHVCWPWCFLSLGTRWCQLCGWNSEGMYRIIFCLKPCCLRRAFHHGYSEKSLLTWVIERAFHTTNNLQLIYTFFPVYFFHLSGNDSVVAPSTDSHPHPLQNRALQVSIPYEGQHWTSDEC